MSRLAATSDVLIVGAGLGGTTLARCLQKHGVQFDIIDKSKDVRKNDHGIYLQRRARDPLLSALSLSHKSLQDAASIEGTAPDASGEERVHRGNLEAWLRKDLNVKWTTEVHNIASRQDGRLQVTCKNETVFAPRLVVAADGVHSTVRKLFLPDTELDVLPYVAFNGKRTASPNSSVLSALSASRDATVHKRIGNTLLQLSFVRGEVCSYTFSRPAHDNNDALYKPNRPNAGASDIPEEFYSELQSLLPSLDPPFSEIFRPDLVRRDTVLSWLIRAGFRNQATVDYKHLTGSGVVLLGDAANPSPVVGGDGANEAILDALLLADAIAGDSVRLDMTKYFDKRVPEWLAKKEESRRRLQHMHSAGEHHL